MEQLSSLASQCRLPEELIICDDGSKDETVAIARSFAQQAPFPVKVKVTDEPLGITRNFARAIELCTGDFIALCDQDDYWHSQKLAKCEEMLVAHPGAGIVVHNSEIVNDDLGSLKTSLWKFLRFDPPAFVGINQAAAVWLKRNPAFGHTIVFRGEFKTAILPIPSDVPADMWIGMIVGMLSDAAFVSEPMSKYRQHAAQLTGDFAKHSGFWEGAGGGDFSGQTDLARNLSLCEHAYHRLQEIDGRAQRAARSVREKAEHLKARTNLSGGMFWRCRIVLQELVSGRYHNYSNGSLSAMKDLLS